MQNIKAKVRHKGQEKANSIIAKCTVIKCHKKLMDIREWIQKYLHDCGKILTQVKYLSNDGLPGMNFIGVFRTLR